MPDIAVDCSQWPGDDTCSVTLVGEENEVLNAAARHRASVHGDDENAARDNVGAAVDDEAKPYAWRIRPDWRIRLQ